MKKTKKNVQQKVSKKTKNEKISEMKKWMKAGFDSKYFIAEMIGTNHQSVYNYYNSLTADEKAEIESEQEKSPLFMFNKNDKDTIHSYIKQLLASNQGLQSETPLEIYVKYGIAKMNANTIKNQDDTLGKTEEFVSVLQELFKLGFIIIEDDINIIFNVLKLYGSDFARASIFKLLIANASRTNKLEGALKMINRIRTLNLIDENDDMLYQPFYELRKWVLDRIRFDQIKNYRESGMPTHSIADKLGISEIEVIRIERNVNNEKKFFDFLGYMGPELEC